MIKAKHYLNQIRRLNTMILNKRIEKEQWWEAATKTTSSFGGDRVQSSGSKQKMADAVGEYVDIGRRIDECIMEMEKAKQDIIHTIEQLPVDEYDVLHKHYVQGLSLMEVAEVKEKSYSLITTVHGRALKKVQAILDSRKEQR